MLSRSPSAHPRVNEPPLLRTSSSTCLNVKRMFAFPSSAPGSSRASQST